jgi:hypothetical protein
MHVAIQRNKKKEKTKTEKENELEKCVCCSIHKIFTIYISYRDLNLICGFNHIIQITETLVSITMHRGRSWKPLAFRVISPGHERY